MSEPDVTRGPLDAALEAAVRAPSPHNTQPWRFEAGHDRIAVFLDRERVLPVVDPDAREARLSCGAAIFNMRVALRAAGRDAVVHLLPDRARPDLLAIVAPGMPHRPRPADAALARAIARRRSNRRPFTDHPVPPRIRQALISAARDEGAELLLVERALLDGAATLLRRAEHMQSEDPAFRDELRKWTTVDGGHQDGVPATAGGPRPAAGSLLALRQFPTDRTRAERPYEQQPLVTVLGSYTDTPLAQLRAGQAMQRVLLTATTEGVSASFLSQPVEVPVTRNALRDLVGGRVHPQAMLRFGYGFATPATPRRPADAVTCRSVLTDPTPERSRHGGASGDQRVRPDRP